MFVAVDRAEPTGGERVAAAEARVAEVMGVVNTALAELAEVVAQVIDEGSWSGPGLASAAQWLAWRTGMSLPRCRDLVQVVERRQELPFTAGAFADGEITLDQAAVIAHHVPEGFDRQATELARSATVSQLKRTLPKIGWDPGPAPKKPDPVERSVSMGHDAKGRWNLRAKLPAEEGAVVEKALKAHRDDLYRQANAEVPDGAEKVRVDNADALLSLAEVGLRAGEAAHPGSSRYLVNTHLEAGSIGPDDVPGSARLSLHWGPLLPAGVRRMLTCDPTLVAYLERNGVPVSVGRKTRLVDDKLRRSIEHRDGGCTAPGCGSRLGIEIHHLHHWEHGGTTDTHNLLCLCRRHHQLHHQGQLAITGNPDLPRGTEGALEFRDPWDHVLDPCGRPILPTPGIRPEVAAAGIGLRPARAYPGATGERLDPTALVICANPGHPASPAEQAKARLAARRARAEQVAAAVAPPPAAGPIHHREAGDADAPPPPTATAFGRPGHLPAPAQPHAVQASDPARAGPA